jgi:hypothetical protein
MKDARPVPSFLERCIVVTAAVLFAAVIIAFVVLNPLLQFLFILGSVVLVLEAILVTAAWRQGLRWFFSRRAVRFHAWLILGLLSGVVLFYSEENWRGRWAWAALQREAAARDESLELSSTFPPAVPLDQNFALAPGVGRVLGYAESGPGDAREPTTVLSFYHGTRDQWPSATWALQQCTDLAAWQKFFRQHPAKGSTAATNRSISLRFPVGPQPQAPAADVLLGLSQFDGDLEVLRGAGQRPGARYPLDYSQGMFALQMPRGLFLENLLSAAHVLGVRSSAELAQGQCEAARQDILLALRLADSLRQEPSWQAQNHRGLMLMFCLQPIWEGLTEQRWTEPQLAALQERLAQADLLPDFRRGLRGETLIMMNLADQFLAFRAGQRSTWGQHLAEAEGADRFWVWLARTAYPTGWLYQDKAWLYRAYQNHSASLQTPRLYAVAEQQWGEELLRATDPLVAVLVVPKVRQLCQDGVAQGLFLHTAFQEASVACALERWRLAQGQYPASLEALVPATLQQVPRDLLDPTGGSLKYRPTPDGGFVLYSIGLDGADDGGKPSPGSKDWGGVASIFPRLGEGDWVWRQGAVLANRK